MGYKQKEIVQILKLKKQKVIRNNNIDQLVDIDNKPIGLIYDLYYKPKPEPFPINLLPKIGLKNIGATCYMNATLRSLAQIEQLVQYFKNKQNTQIIDSSIAKCKQNNKKSLFFYFHYIGKNKYTLYIIY